MRSEIALYILLVALIGSKLVMSRLISDVDVWRRVLVSILGVLYLYPQMSPCPSRTKQTVGSNRKTKPT
jgi:hypothetical protein